jgi:hypothetical protein
MNQDDRAAFGEAMTRLFAIYAQPVTPSLLDGWWGTLRAYDLQEVRKAMSVHACDPDGGRFAPKPADIIRHLTITMPAKRREARARQAAELRDRLEPLHDRFLILKKTLELCELTPEKKLQAAGEMQGLAMQIGGLRRELAQLGVNDAPRLARPPVNPDGLASALHSALTALGTDHEDSSPDH